MKPKVQTLGAAVARERRDSGQVRLSTFIPLKIRKRGGSKVVVRPDGRVDTGGENRTRPFFPVTFCRSVESAARLPPALPPGSPARRGQYRS
jgi:hypothetical protein